MATRTLEVNITGDASSLNRALRGTTSSTSKSRAAFARLGQAAKLAGVAIAAGVGLELKRSIDQARESIKVTSQTNAVLKSTGKAAHVSAKGVEELASAISLKAGIDDEAIQSGANILLTFKNIRNEAGKGNKIFSKTTRTITDLSVAMDQPLKNSAIQVGKALNDPITGLTSLTRIGVTFTDQQKKQIAALVESGKRLKAQKIILGELNSEFGGSAAAQADSMDKLKVAWENLEEALGKKLIPILSDGAQALAKFLNQMQTGKGVGGGFVDTMKGIGTAVGAVVSALSTAFTASKRFIQGILQTEDWKTFAAAVRNVAAAFKFVFEKVVGPVLRVSLAVAKRVVKGILEAFKGMAQVLRGVVQVISGILTLRFGKVWEGLKNIFRGGVKTIIGMLRASTAPFREIASRIGDALSSVFGGAWDKVKGIFRSGAKAVTAIVNAIIGVINKIPGVNIPTVGGKGGGKAPAGPKGPVGRARGGAITRPMAIVGEEAPQHHEWVIASNPAYRRDNLGYWAKAGADLGVPGFAVGGALKGAAGAVGGAAKGLAGLAAKPAKFFLDKLPSPGDFLPPWLVGTGEFMLKKAADYIKNKVASPFAGHGGTLSGGIVGIGRILQKAGFAVAGHPSFPPVGAHTSGSLHYSGRAIDVNRDGGPGSEPSYLSPLFNALVGTHPTELFYQNRGIPTAVADHYDHLHLGYRKGGLVVSGKTSWFSPGDAPNITADGKHTAADPGFAIRDHSTLGHWFWAQVGGKQGMLQHTDWGPAAWTGRNIDFTRAGLSKIGASTSITNTTAKVSWLGRTLGAAKRQATSLGLLRGGKPKGKPKIGSHFAGQGGKHKGKGKFSPHLGAAEAVSPGWSYGGGGDATGGGEVGEDPAAEAAAALAEAIAAQVEATNQLKDEMKRQNEFAAAVNSVSLREAWRALADLVSGQIAGNLQPIGGTKPAGMAGINRF